MQQMVFSAYIMLFYSFKGSIICKNENGTMTAAGEVGEGLIAKEQVITGLTKCCKTPLRRASAREHVRLKFHFIYN